MSGSAELSGGKVSTASPPPPATHPPDSSLEPPPPGGGGHHSGTPAGGPPPGLSIPDGFQCTRKAACVKPAGHIGRCKTKFATEEERRQALQAHVSAFLAAGGSDSDSEDDTPAAGRRGPGAAALAPSTQDILLDIQQQLAQLTTTMGLQQQVISGLAGQQAGQGVASGSSLATLPQQGPTAVAPPSPHPSLAGAAAPAALQQQLESLLGNNPFATDPSAFTNATAGQLPGLNAHAQQVAAAAGTMPLHTTVPIPITGIGASPGVSVSAPGECGVGGFDTTGRTAVRVPPQPILVEQVAAQPSFMGAFQQETRLQWVIDVRGQQVLRPAAAPLPGGHKLKSGAELGGLIADYSAYMEAANRVTQILQLHAYSTEGMQQFHAAMLQLARHVNHSDKEEWVMLLELERTLRLTQHALQLSWGHEGGYIDREACMAFRAAVAGRQAALKAASAAPQRRLPQGSSKPGSTFRASAGTQQGAGGSRAGPQPDRSKHCMQFWRTGTCTFKNCRFPHECATCGSSEHGTAQCPSGGRSG